MHTKPLSTQRHKRIAKPGSHQVSVAVQVLGPLFEPYFVPIIDIVLAGFGDQNNDVKMAASDASKALMKSMSGPSPDVGVRTR